MRYVSRAQNALKCVRGPERGYARTPLGVHIAPDPIAKLEKGKVREREEEGKEEEKDRKGEKRKGREFGNFYVQVLFEFMFVTLDYRKRFLAWLLLSVQ